MSLKLSFCVKAATTLNAQDLDTLTDGIGHYQAAGMAAPQAEAAAVADLIAAVQAEHTELVGHLREQHPDLFKSDRALPAQPPKARGILPVRGSDALGQISSRLGGISSALLPDLSQKVQRKTKAGGTYSVWDNPMQPGAGPLFRAGGTADLSEIARVLEEAGYLTPGSDHPEQQAEALIKAELNKGGSSVRVGDAASIEAEMQRRQELAQDVPDLPDDLFDHLTDADLAESGYAEAVPEVKALTERLMADAKAAGIDTETARDHAARGIEDQSEDFYHARLQALLAQALAGPVERAAGHDPGAAARSGERGRETAGSEEPGAGPTTRDTGHAEPGGLTLEAQDAASLQAKTARETQARAADRTEQQRLTDKAKADAQVGDFTLTGSDRAADQNPDQGVMFSENPDFQDTELLARPEVSDGTPAPQDAAALAKVEAAFRGKVDAFKGLKLTALPRLEKPGNQSSEAERQRYAAADLAEKLFGKRVVFFSANMQFANGLQADYLPGMIFVSEATTRPIQAVLGHELTHSLRTDDPKLYEQLSNRLRGLLEEPGRYGEQLNARRAARGLSPLNFDKLREELIADIVGDNFTDPQFWRQMAQGQPSLFGRVLRVVRDFFDNLLAKLRNERPYGTGKYLNDIQAARDAVVETMSQFAASPKTVANAVTTAAQANLSDTHEPFYSELARQVETAKMTSAPAQGWKDWLKGLVNKGTVKADELAWTGIEDFLNLQTGKVSREQVMDFLNANGVKVTETTLSDQQTRMLPDGWEVVPEDGGFSVHDQDGEHMGFGSTADDAIADAQDGAAYQDTPNAPKYSQYTLPGGTNYREVLLTLPGNAQAKPGPDGQVAFKEEYQSPHWDTPNVLAHIRLDDRTDSEGRRVLMVQEIQSDWAQTGKKKGFQGDLIPQNTNWQAVDTLDRFDTHAAADHWIERNPPPYPGANMEARLVVREVESGGYDVIEEQRSTVATAPSRGGVPRAPFIQKTDAWVALSIKRVIKLAADEGYDRVAFVNGKQSAERYSLSKQVDTVSWEATRQDGAAKNIELKIPNQNPIRLRVDGDGAVLAANGPGFQQFEGKQIDDIIGKDLAKKIMGETTNGSLSGAGLDIGGEGMKAFYDKIVPTVAKDVVKKLGGGPLTTMDVGHRERSFAPGASEQEQPGGPPLRVVEHPQTGMLTIELGNDAGYWGTWSSTPTGRAMAENRLQELKDAYVEKPNAQLGFDITPAMREKAAGGLPMFSLQETPDERRRSADLPGQGLLHHALTRVSELIDHGLDAAGIYPLVAPMSGGTDRTRAMAQAHINAERVANHQWQTVDAELAKSFTPFARKAMWEAADQQNDLLMAGKTPGPTEGINRLTPAQREVMDTLHAYSKKLWREGKAVGLVTGDGVAYWAPRMMAMVSGEGEFSRPGEPGAKTTSDGLGRNIVTSAGSAKARKYTTSAESEAAMQSKGGALVRDIRTMPLAMARFERAIAGRMLINQIKDLGTVTGTPLVSESREPGFFTLDHPAFTTLRPRTTTDAAGKITPILTEAGNPVMDRVPIYISKEFEGPLRAIMSNNDGVLYRAYMLLKSKAMSAIMISPLIHNMVIAGRAFAYAGLRLPTLYFTGNRVRADPQKMRLFIQHGMVPISGSNHSLMDVGDIARGVGKPGGWGDPNESWIGLGARVAGNAVKTGLGDTIKAGVDKAGDFWHGTLLWNRVGDLQAGIADHAYTRLINRGMDTNAAATVAAHMANRYAGAVGRENMSEIARKFLNVVLFSRSFNTGNVGAVKDVFYGLPAGLKAQLFEKSGIESAMQAMTFAKRKAFSGLVTDLAATILITSLVQDLFKRHKDDDWAEELKAALMGYGQRAAAMWAHLKEHPTQASSYDPYRLSSTWGNEPGKQDRVDVGAQPTGRHEYMRLPTGKVVEDTIGWMTHPVDTFAKKMSPLAKSVTDIAANNKGFGVPVYDPNESLIKKAMDIAGHLVASEVPIDTLKAGKDLASGTATDLDKKKLIGNITGLSISQGHPGGPEAAVAQKTTDRIEQSKKYVMEAVKRDIKYGEDDRARARLEEIGLTPREVNQVIRRIESPKGGMSASVRTKFKRHANDEENETMGSVRATEQVNAQ